MPHRLDTPKTDTGLESMRKRPSFASLISGLMQDLKTLITQELKLAKDEILHELAKIMTATRSFGIGIGLIGLGGLLLIIMLVHGLHALTDLPLWACYGIVGGLCIGGGMALLAKGKGTVADIHMIPPKTVQTLKENATWIKDRTLFNKM